MTVNLTPFQRKVAANCLTLRNFIRNYIRDRKSGKRKSVLKNNSDMLSLFFENSNVFDEETIIDEMLDFFFAGS